MVGDVALPRRGSTAAEAVRGFGRAPKGRVAAYTRPRPSGRRAGSSLPAGSHPRRSPARRLPSIPQCARRRAAPGAVRRVAPRAGAPRRPVGRGGTGATARPRGSRECCWWACHGQGVEPARVERAPSSMCCQRAPRRSGRRPGVPTPTAVSGRNARRGRRGATSPCRGLRRPRSPRATGFASSQARPSAFAAPSPGCGPMPDGSVSGIGRPGAPPHELPVAVGGEHEVVGSSCRVRGRASTASARAPASGKRAPPRRRPRASSCRAPGRSCRPPHPPDEAATPPHASASVAGRTHRTPSSACPRALAPR